MAKINSEQLSLLRQYFLSFTGSEKVETSRIINDQLNSGFLKGLEKLFTSDGYSKDNLTCYLEKYQSEDLSKELHEIQEEFLFNQAELLIQGEKNSAIDEMATRRNRNFLNEVGFQSAMRQSIKLIELEDSRNEFLEIHQSVQKEKTSFQGVFNLPEESAPRQISRKSPRRRYLVAGIAASAVVAVVYFISEKKKSFKDVNKTQQTSLYINISDKETANYLSQHFEVLPNTLLKVGYKEPDTIYSGLKTIWLKVFNPLEISKKASYVKNELPDFKWESVMNTYKFDNETLLIISTNFKKPTVYNISGSYFLKLNSAIYPIKNTSTPTPLTEIDNAQIRASIQQIGRGVH